MNTVISIDGGAGRVLCAIPALEKFARLNPKDDFKVMIAGWGDLLKNHPMLESRVIPWGQPGMFNAVIKSRKFIAPEPYRNYGYYNQLIHLTEAFDREINKTSKHEDLGKINLFPTTDEISIISSKLSEIKRITDKKTVVVFQPYGSTAKRTSNGDIIDNSGRSLDQKTVLEIAKQLSKDSVVCYFGPQELFDRSDVWSTTFFNMNPNLRFYMSLISNCDYFVGVDSVGQHMARAFDKPGCIFMGGTFEVNVSYPDHFKIFRNGVKPIYSPIRIDEFDSQLADSNNIATMEISGIKLMKCINEMKEEIAKV